MATSSAEILAAAVRELRALGDLLRRHIDDEERSLGEIRDGARDHNARREIEHRDEMALTSEHNDKLVEVGARLDAALDVLADLAAGARSLWTDEIRRRVREDTRHDVRQEMAVLAGDIRDELRALLASAPAKAPPPDEVTAELRAAMPLAVRVWRRAVPWVSRYLLPLTVGGGIVEAARRLLGAGH